MKAIVITAFFFAGVQFSTSAQTVYGETNTWFFLLNHLELNEKWSLSMESHERLGGFFRYQGHVLLRPSVNYHVNPNTILSMGYTFIESWPYGSYSLPIRKQENNLWEQVTLKFDIGKMKFSNRIRQEHRWSQHIVKNGSTSYIDGVSYINRLRFRLTGKRDLFSVGKDDKVFVQIFDELWIDQNEKLIPSKLGRNWLYAGLGYSFSPRFSVQLGYMGQVDLTNTGSINTPILQTMVVYRFTLIKKGAR